MTTCYTPDGHKRPVLNVNSKFLIYMWNVPNNVPISAIKKVSERVRFVETFEAWKNKKIGQLIIEFADRQGLDKFVKSLSQKEILNFDPPVEFRIYDPKFGTRSFFDYIHQWSGVDLLACQAVPESFDYHKKPLSNTTTRSSSQLRASASPFVPRTNINPSPSTRQQNETSNIQQNGNREFVYRNGMRQQNGRFGGGRGGCGQGGENGTRNTQNDNKEFGTENGMWQQIGGFGRGRSRRRGDGQILMQSQADSNISQNKASEINGDWPTAEEVNLNGKMAANPPTTAINMAEEFPGCDETNSPQFDRQPNGPSEEEEVKMPEKTVNNNQDEGDGLISDWSTEEEDGNGDLDENIPQTTPTNTNMATEFVDRNKADSPQFNQYREPKGSWEEDEHKKTLLIQKTEASFTFYDSADATNAMVQIQNGSHQWLLGKEATVQLIS